MSLTNKSISPKGSSRLVKDKGFVEIILILSWPVKFREHEKREQLAGAE